VGQASRLSMTGKMPVPPTPGRAPKTDKPGRLLDPGLRRGDGGLGPTQKMTGRDARPTM
jgi:hypothetical protein